MPLPYSLTSLLACLAPLLQEVEEAGVARLERLEQTLGRELPPHLAIVSSAVHSETCGPK